MIEQLHQSGRVHPLRCLAPALLAAATTGGLAVQRMRQLRLQLDEARRAAEAADRQAQMLRQRERSLAAAARALSSGADVQAQICEAARASAHARFALLREPNMDDRLVQTASVGIDLPPLPLDPDEEPSGAAHAFATRRRLVVPKASRDPRVSRRLVAASGAGSLLFEPVLRGTEAIGVLVVGWRQPADDLSSWPLSALSLLAAEAALGIDRARLQSELEAAARSDPLTALPNRRVWAERLPLELARAARLGRPVTVGLLDLDHFKRFNDQHGHQAGDRQLRAVAAAWRDKLRDNDLLCRYGGEEFAILLPNKTLDEARKAIERLRRATPGQTCSAGIAEWDGAEDIDTLLARADRALYHAKNSGRDRTHAAPAPGAFPARWRPPDSRMGASTPGRHS
jgi:diguanylate cyclase (GGDEF)-like protein